MIYFGIIIFIIIFKKALEQIIFLKYSATKIHYVSFSLLKITQSTVLKKTIKLGIQ